MGNGAWCFVAPTQRGYFCYFLVSFCVQCLQLIPNWGQGRCPTPEFTGVWTRSNVEQLWGRGGGGFLGSGWLWAAASRSPFGDTLESKRYLLSLISPPCLCSCRLFVSDNREFDSGSITGNEEQTQLCKRARLSQCFFTQPCIILLRFRRVQQQLCKPDQVETKQQTFLCISEKFFCFPYGNSSWGIEFKNQNLLFDCTKTKTHKTVVTRMELAYCIHPCSWTLILLTFQEIDLSLVVVWFFFK